MALRDAEAKMDGLIAKYCLWLQTECCDLPPVFRFDAFLRVKTSDPALCDVFSGELTELGACTLGWDLPDMVTHLFPAVLGSFLEDAPCQAGAKCLCHKPRAAGEVDARCDVSAFVKDLQKRQAAHAQWEAQRNGEYEEGASRGDGGGAEETGESEGGEPGDDEEDDDGNTGGGSGGGAAGGAAGLAANGAAAKKKKRKKAKKPTQVPKE